MFPSWRAYLHAIAVLCALFATACRGPDKAKTPQLHTVYGVFDPALERLADLTAPVAVRTDNHRLKIVQFIGQIQPGWRQVILDHGVPILGYMPDDAFVVEATYEDACWLATLPMVRAVTDEPRLWRIDPRLIAVPDNKQSLAVREDLGTMDVTIEIANAGVRSQVVAMISAMHGSVVDDAIVNPGGRVLHARLVAHQIDELAADSYVSAIEPFVPVHPANDMSYGMVQAGAVHHASVWSHGLRGQNQIVATCDTGVLTNSCYFGGDKIVAYQNVTSSTEHDHNHGTHTAGTIAGDRNNNGIYDTSDGMAPAARLFVQDAGTTHAGEMSVPMDLGTLFKPAYDAAARIQSNAWTGDADVYGARERSLDAFVAAHRDFLVIAANGNLGGAPGTVGSPATAKNLIAVGALSSAAPEDVSAFSSHGPTGDNRIKPTLLAPGEGIVSASGQAMCATAVGSGTSMAAPALAGAAALVRQYYEEGFYPGGVAEASHAMQPSAALIKATLLAGADDMVGHGTDGAFPAEGQGFGRVHLDNALVFGSDSQRLYVRDDQEGLGQANAFTIPIEVRGGALHVALTWMDEPGIAGAASALVNDLDLELMGPDGTRYFGNQLNGGESVSTPAGDHANVEEILFFAHATPGIYRLTVRAYNAPLAPQPYALVISGDLGEQTGQHATYNEAAAAVGQRPQATAPASRDGCEMAPLGGMHAAALGLWVYVRKRKAGWRRARRQ